MGQDGCRGRPDAVAEEQHEEHQDGRREDRRFAPQRLPLDRLQLLFAQIGLLGLELCDPPFERRSIRGGGELNGQGRDGRIRS